MTVYDEDVDAVVSNCE